MPAHAAMSGPKTTLSRATGTPAPTCSQISAVPNIKIPWRPESNFSGAEGRDGGALAIPGISSVNRGA